MNWKQYFGEGILIVFSVLLALFLNQWSQEIKRDEETKIARESIEREIKRNLQIIENWQTKHERMAQLSESLKSHKNDSLLNLLKTSDHFRLEILTGNESLIDANLNNAAWETARSTGILSEFDFQTVEKLNETYALQEILVEKTLHELVQLYFSRQTHDLLQLNSTLNQFYLRLSELSGQEYLLSLLYKQSLENLEKN